MSDLDTAWEAVEAVRGTLFLKIVGPEGNPPYWRAMVFGWVGRMRPNKDYREVEARGQTPTYALLALAEKLKSGQG